MLDYLVWLDSDVVEYPRELPTLLISANPLGVCVYLCVYILMCIIVYICVYM